MSFLTPDILVLLWRGMGFTLLLTVVTTLLSLIIGITIGALRLAGQPLLRHLAAIYVDIFRNIPALVLIIFWAFAVPNVFAPETRRLLFFDNIWVAWSQAVTGLSLPYYALAAIMALTLNTSAYLAELFRAGVSAIPQEIVDVARSLGASPRAIFRRILLPQGVRIAFPAMSTRLIHNLKNTALASLVTVPELFQATQTAISQTFQAVELLLLASVLYWLLAFALAALLQGVDRRLHTAV